MAGYILLAVGILATGAASAWLALARTRDMGVSTPLLAAFSWFPLVGIFTVFGGPIDKRFSSPTWGHFAKRFGLALLLPALAFGLIVVVHALTADRVLLAQARIEELSRSTVKVMIAEQVDAGAPLALDRSTVLLGAEIIEGALFYVYELTPDVTDAGETRFNSWAKSKMIPRLCEGSALSAFAESGIDISLAYLDTNGELFSVVVFDEETCS